MFKKIVFSTLVIFGAHLNATVYFSPGVNATDIQKSKNIQVAWDIHDVLAQKDRWEKAGAIASNIFSIAWTKLTGNKAWKEIDQIKKQNKNVSGEAYSQVFLKHGQKDLAIMAQEAANAYIPQEGIDKLVRDLHTAGITQRLASNIGPEFLISLDAKFKRDYRCMIFDIIKPGKVVDYSKYGKNPSQPTRLAAHLTNAEKPQPQFFADFNKTYNIGQNSYTIFIDDKIENIRAALAQAAADNTKWIGIHVDVTNKKQKPVEQIRADLNALGIFKRRK